MFDDEANLYQALDELRKLLAEGRGATTRLQGTPIQPSLNVLYTLVKGLLDRTDTLAMHIER